MLYKLVDNDGKNVSELLADELPEVGSTIKASQATYRVKEILWAQKVDSNSVPSGSILVMPL
jgi:hypothetical protein